jgi:hypothetical protein
VKSRRNASSRKRPVVAGLPPPKLPPMNRAQHCVPKSAPGHLAQQLVRAVTAHHADLLILGHSRHSAIWRRFIGTTVEKAAHHVDCSVLVVK